RARRDADLVSGAVVTDRGSHRVRAMRDADERVVVARRLEVEAAGIGSVAADVAVHGVPPAVVVPCRRPVPAAVARLERRNLPGDTGVRVGVDESLALVAERPDRGSSDLLDVPLDASRR